MNTREVAPMKGELDFTLALPGSKSVTNRAFLCAALAKGKSRLYGALKSDDAEVMLRALKLFGVKIRETKAFVEIQGVGGNFKKGKITVDLHNAGTATRFLTAISVLRQGETLITGDSRMQERPIADLVEGLRQLGAEVEYLGSHGCPPLRVKGLSGAQRYTIRMKGDKSSQYFSALLMLGPMLGCPLRIEVTSELVSKPYIDTTIAVMKVFGVRVKNHDYKAFEISPQSYKPAEYNIEGDASSATYFSALQFLHGGRLEFENLDTGKSVQGDVNFSEVLKKLETRNSKLERVIDMGAMPDAAMTLAVCAALSKGRTKITGLSTLRIKETDRLAALEAELSKVGAKVSTTKNSITVVGGALHGARIVTYNDHRMAMCFAVLGTKVPGIVIEHPKCTEKTYPDFWEDLEKIYLTPIRLGQKNLLLTGMRCSGKSFYGKKIARRLGRKFVDIDHEIEQTEGMSIDRLVELKGWDYFRNIEQKMCSKFAGAKNLVIATGGGVVLSPGNMRSLKKNSVNVFIFADPGILSFRLIEYGNRPSLTGEAIENEVHVVWEERRDLYLKYADYVWDDTGGEALQTVFDKLN